MTCRTWVASRSWPIASTSSSSTPPAPDGDPDALDLGVQDTGPDGAWRAARLPASAGPGRRIAAAQRDLVRSPTVEGEVSNELTKRMPEPYRRTLHPVRRGPPLRAAVPARRPPGGARARGRHLAAGAEAPAATLTWAPDVSDVVRLLGPFDLFLQARDRELVVPGGVLVGHEGLGTWRLAGHRGVEFAGFVE